MDHPEFRHKACLAQTLHFPPEPHSLCLLCILRTPMEDGPESKFWVLCTLVPSLENTWTWAFLLHPNVMKISGSYSSCSVGTAPSLSLPTCTHSFLKGWSIREVPQSQPCPLGLLVPLFPLSHSHGNKRVLSLCIDCHVCGFLRLMQFTWLLCQTVPVLLLVSVSNLHKLWSGNIGDRLQGHHWVWHSTQQESRRAVMGHLRDRVSKPPPHTIWEAKELF